MRYIDTRHRTRDLLLEYETSILPLYPRAGGIPWAVTTIGDQLYKFAAKSGYKGTRDDFIHNFGSYLESNKRDVLFDIFANFPAVGEQDMLYFDLNDKILYYWDNEYIPVNAMLINNAVLNGGEA